MDAAHHRTSLLAKSAAPCMGGSTGRETAALGPCASALAREPAAGTPLSAAAVTEMIPGVCEPHAPPPIPYTMRLLPDCTPAYRAWRAGRRVAAERQMAMVLRD